MNKEGITDIVFFIVSPPLFFASKVYGFFAKKSDTPPADSDNTDNKNDSK